MLSTWEQMLGRWKRGFSDGFYVALVVASWKDGEGNGNPLQYSCLENAVDRGAWWAAVHGVTKSRTRLSNFTFTFHFHALEKEMSTHSIVLAWRIPGTGEPGELPSMGSHRVGHDWNDLAAGKTENAMAPHSSTLAWKMPWTEEPGGLQSMGLLRVGHDWTNSLSLSCIGEGNGNPLHCSCLENLRDRGAWWAAVYGVAQSQTWLKRLSSSMHKEQVKLSNVEESK